MSAIASPASAPAGTRSRIDSIDVLRGVVMVIMALDHVRDFLHAGSQLYSPENLAHTNSILFFTRWITHFCAPVFMFLSGVSIYLVMARKGGPETSSFLVKRGVWLIFLECTILNLIFNFNLRFEVVILQVIWAFGWSMIAMAVLVRLPQRIVLILAVATIALHNTLDGIKPEQFGSLNWLWQVLHVPGMLKVGGVQVMLLYPLVPWVAVMAAGYCLGPVFLLTHEQRRRILLRMGAISTAGFFGLRFVNLYGDAQPWSVKSTFTLTVITFFRTQKYPPSLLYLLMTLGPALIFLALMDGVRVSETNPFRVFGRVPMFYYVLHFFSVHLLAVILAQVVYGRFDFVLRLPPSAMGFFPPGFPTDYGVNLFLTYVFWLSLVAALYFPCRWYMGMKQRSRSAWVSYL